jgi:hypothetical protein
MCTGMDLRRLRRRVAAGLGLARYPVGYEPPPGAATRRILFALVWFVVAIALIRAFLAGGELPFAAVAAFWLTLGAVDLGRGARLLQAERHRDG